MKLLKPEKEKLFPYTSQKGVGGGSSERILSHVGIFSAASAATLEST